RTGGWLAVIGRAASPSEKYRAPTHRSRLRGVEAARPKRERPFLFQEARKGSTCSGFELLGINRSFVVWIGRLEAFLDDRQKLIFVQRPVIVGIGRSEIAAVDPTTQFAFVESAVVIAIELVE